MKVWRDAVQAMPARWARGKTALCAARSSKTRVCTPIPLPLQLLRSNGEAVSEVQDSGRGGLWLWQHPGVGGSAQRGGGPAAAGRAPRRRTGRETMRKRIAPMAHVRRCISGFPPVYVLILQEDRIL